MTRPTDEGWIPWKGGDCPVEPGTVVEVKWRDIPGQSGKKTAKGLAGIYAWWHEPGSGYGDIVAYRVVQL